MSLGAAVGLVVACAVTVGCEGRFFHAEGVVKSDDGPLGRWSLTPVSCGRGLGRDAGQGRSVVTLLWADPARTNKRYLNQGQYTAPVVPLRLDVLGDGENTVAVMDLWRRSGVVMGRETCRQLGLKTEEAAAAVREGRPTLRGRLQMDCVVEGSHVTADLRFSGCEY